MMLSLLRRLEQDIAATLSEQELRRMDGAVFDSLRALGVLTRVAADGAVTARVVDGRLLTVAIGPDGEAEAFDPDEPDEAPITLDDSCLRTWRPDPLRIAALIGERNSLLGPAEQVGLQLFYVGRTPSGAAVTLGLFPNVSAAAGSLVALPALLSGSPQTHHAVILPSLAPSQKMLKVLQPMNIATGSLTDELEIVPPLDGMFPDRPAASGELATNGPFRHVPSFRWIEVDGQEYIPSIHQAMVLARMHEVGEPVSETEVLEEFEDEIVSKRFVDVFKGSKLLNAFVIPLGKGLYKLKYY